MLLLSYVLLIILSTPLFRDREAGFGKWIEEHTPRHFITRQIGLDESWKHLCYDILLPLFSGICTASREEILVHPVADFQGLRP